MLDHSVALLGFLKGDVAQVQNGGQNTPNGLALIVCEVDDFQSSQHLLEVTLVVDRIHSAAVTLWKRR